MHACQHVLLLLQTGTLYSHNAIFNICHSEFAYGIAEKVNSSKIIGGGVLAMYFDIMAIMKFRCIPLTAVCMTIFLLLEPTCSSTMK